MALPIWIVNILTGLGSTDITVYAGFARTLQVLLAIVLIGISGNLIGNNNSSLPSFASEIDSLLGSSNITATLFKAEGSSVNSTSIILSSLKSTSSLGAATGVFTALSHTSFSLIPYAFSRVSNSMLSSTELTSLNGLFSTLSTSEGVYASGVSGTELSSLTMWSASAIYSTAKYGNWDCTDPGKLISQYNSSYTVDYTSIALFNELLSYDGESFIGNADNLTTSLLNGMQSVYDLFNDTITLSGANLSLVTSKQELMVRLSQDCIMKKVSISVVWLGVATFVFSSALVAVSANRLSNGTALTATPFTTIITKIHSVAITNIGYEMRSRLSNNIHYHFVLTVPSLNQIIPTRLSSSLLNEDVWEAKVLDEAEEGSLMTTHVCPFVVDDICAIFEGSGSGEDWRRIKQIVLYLTVQDKGVRVIYELECDDGRESGKSIVNDIEKQNDSDVKYRLIYSRAILFPQPTRMV
ncbi:hypothetical protein BON22_5142 [Cyberlindnera fabianii]|uniref:Uncharacterized protein n=1 Tax=Cyberlindnera fabianii TaxID=36022 RepID=A0A1V2KZP1_CYBFA|nr:hypothetical protein BON22_5142 [Cyberlindnera fabianii]